jgi:hypothetical protein
MDVATQLLTRLRDCNTDCPLNATGNMGGVQYDYCLAKKIKQNCKLQFSTQILTVVIVCNFAKTALMLMTLWRQGEETLLTFGDAIASWLDRPDGATKGECLASRITLWSTLLDTTWYFKPDPKPFGHAPRQDPGVLRWHAAVSSVQWRATMVFFLITISIPTALLVMLGRIKHSQDETLSFGKARDFGAVDPSSVITTRLPRNGAAGLMAAVLVVNSPQLIVTFCYLLYNGLFTAMHLSHEYSGYAKQRKPLRVTTPRGTQRSTYWLQLPYTYGLPLIVASAVLHWLVSQSIFLVRIRDFVDYDGYGQAAGEESTLDPNESQIGFSSAPIVACIVLATCMLVTLIGMGFRKLESSMPVAASCSFALAAATHRPEEDVDASVLPVMWGEVPEMGNGDVGHCCFTSQKVVPLRRGRKYAGARGDGSTNITSNGR